MEFPKRKANSQASAWKFIFVQAVVSYWILMTISLEGSQKLLIEFNIHPWRCLSLFACLPEWTAKVLSITIAYSKTIQGNANMPQFPHYKHIKIELNDQNRWYPIQNLRRD